MTMYLISFPAAAMTAPAGELAAVGEAARRVIRDAKAAGVYVFGGGLDASVPPVLVHADGSTGNDGHPPARDLDGGFCILNLPSRDAALQWAARLAAACRCPQELRAFGYDPES